MMSALHLYFLGTLGIRYDDQELPNCKRTRIFSSWRFHPRYDIILC
jgi:hypothetical protein